MLCITFCFLVWPDGGLIIKLMLGSTNIFIGFYTLTQLDE